MRYLNRCLTRLIAVLFITLLTGECVVADESEAAYPELGITLGGIPHISAGYWWGRKGVRLSAMKLSDEKEEYHLNFGYVLSDTNNIQRSINVLTSWVVGSDPGADYDYVATGVAYGINYKGFFLEVGLGIPWEDNIGNLENDPVIPVGYLGYIYRFGAR